MKICTNILSVSLAAGLCAGGAAVHAQTNPPSALPAAGSEAGAGDGGGTLSTSPADATITRDGQVLVPVKPAELGSVVGVALERPVVPEHIALTPELRERLRRFERYRQDYLARQEALRKKFLIATDDDRAAIRLRLQRLREQWLERTRALRQEFHERQRELLDKLKEHQDVIHSTREEARDAVRDQMLDQRRELRDQLQEEGRPR
ncbi:MAG: hypothetical protein JXQ71_12695 [Verrucomicrobia bacterium]|nr:hypothetical protein [Verrucomicrobiota bacterium]